MKMSGLANKVTVLGGILTTLCSITRAKQPFDTVKVIITSELPLSNVPMEVPIDFGEIIRQNHPGGVLDRNSIEVVNRTTGAAEEVSLSLALTYLDKGLVRWVVKNPEHREYEIRFRTGDQRTFPEPRLYHPLIGTGDWLRYNAGAPRPVALPNTVTLTDVTGDGRKDLVGTWTQPRYPRGLAVALPGEIPVVYPRVGPAEEFLFGEAIVWPEPLGFELNPYGTEARFDVDGDGLQDKVEVVYRTVEFEGKPRRIHSGAAPDYPLIWRKRLSSESEDYGPAEDLVEFRGLVIRQVWPAEDTGRRGLLVHLDGGQDVVFYQQEIDPKQCSYFKRWATAQSAAGVVNMGQQAVAEICDWDDDGDWDLLIGTHLGRVRIVINEGTNERPALAAFQEVCSEGEPIRIWMSQVYPNCENHIWHDLGYAYPSFVDWDGDGLKDLMLPNEANRIFWYKNVGVRGKPVFGPRRQLNPAGYEDTPEKRAATGRAVMAGKEAAPDPGQPFWWRIGAGFADLNGDGLMDMITPDGEFRKLTLFSQHRNAQGQLCLKMDRRLTLTDGTEIDDSVIKREKHWGEHFKCADWNGDGLIDIFYSVGGAHGKVQDGGSMFLFINAGTKTNPVFSAPRTVCCFGEPIMTTKHGPRAAVGDINGDNKPDILCGCEDGLFMFFSHAALEMKQRPQYIVQPLREK